MTMILPNLVVGSFEESFNIDILSKQKISHILNVAAECEVSERVGLVYAKHAVADDCKDEDISVILDECLDYIRKAHTEGGTVFVHCLEGKSRSICVCIAYMVKVLCWDFQDAYTTIASKRQIDIYGIYLSQTRDYAQIIPFGYYGESDLDSDEHTNGI